MPKYLVTWEIDSEADNPLDAANEAYMHMRRDDSTACVFTVQQDSLEGPRWSVDLNETFKNAVTALPAADTPADKVRILQLEAALMPFIRFSHALHEMRSTEAVATVRGQGLLVKHFRDARTQFLNHNEEQAT